jgi:monoamine oxidase
MQHIDHYHKSNILSRFLKAKQNKEHHVPVTTFSFRVQEVKPVRDNLRVGIIGAGITGLYAAEVLKKATGIKATIMEATDRVGGRILTHHFDSDKYQYVDVGAMRIPESHTEVLALAKELNLEVIDYYFNDENNNNLYYLNKTKEPNGKIMTKGYAGDHPDEIGYIKINTCFECATYSDNGTINLHLKTGVDPKNWANVQSIYGAVYDFLKNEFDNLKVEGFFDKYDQYSVESFFHYIIPQWLQRDCVTVPNVEDVKNLILQILDFAEQDSSGTGLNHLALSEGVLDNRHFDAKKWYTILGGLDQIPTRVAEKLEHDNVNIMKNSEVFKIEVSDNLSIPVKVHYYNQAKEEKLIEFDRIIITAPFCTVRRWDINPGFTFFKTQAIRSFNYDHSTKVCLQVPNRFWEIDGNMKGGQSKTDLPLCNVVYPSYPNKGIDDSGKGSFIASYTWQNDAVMWANMDDETRLRLCIRNLETLHGVKLNKDDVKIFTQTWHEAFAMYGPGQYSQMFKAMIPEKNVHFAGEHLSTEHAWIIGALYSAKRAVREILVLEGFRGIDASFKEIPDGDFTPESWEVYCQQFVSKHEE